MARTNRSESTDKPEDLTKASRFLPDRRDPGSPYQDSLHAWQHCKLSEWTHEEAIELRRLMRTANEGTSPFRVDLGQQGQGVSRVYWVASFPCPDGTHTIALGYARGSARATEKALRARGWLEPIATKDLATLRTIWPLRRTVQDPAWEMLSPEAPAPVST